MSCRVFLAMGTNLGDRLANLHSALQALPPDVQPVRASQVYETAPWGVQDQPDFLNQVIEAETDLTPESLLAYLKSIEAKLGRAPTYRYGPRLIDLDIVFYENWVLDQPDLAIPHPRISERAFVLVPLVEIAPDLVDPVSGQRVSSWLKKLGQDGVKLFEAEKNKSRQE